MSRRIDLVLEGGGIRGVALAGAIEALVDAGCQPVNIAGTSAGAIVAALVAADYGPADLERIAVDQAFADLLDPVRPWIPGRRIRAAAGVLTDWGVYRGDRFVDWLGGLLKDKGCACFGACMGGITDRGSKSRLRIVSSDITRGRIFVFPDDLPSLGIDPASFPIAAAVRASISIPFVFRPYSLGHGRDATRFVDGGLLSNFPIGLFDDPANAIRPTIGVRISRRAEPRPIRGLREYFSAIARTAISAIDARDVVKAADAVRTIQIDIEGVAVTDFGLSPARRHDLYHVGRRAAEAFLAESDDGR